MSDSVLFVCLGNICRSPLAEAAFRHEARLTGLDVAIDSAGTGDWHLGQAPDPRAQAVARKYGVDISAYRARQVMVADFGRFKHIVALDTQNLADLRALQPASSATRLSLLLDHIVGREGQSVADPYYGDADAFERAWAEVTMGAVGLLERLGKER
jgi:protein-tyrosine phosphatase